MYACVSFFIQILYLKSIDRLLIIGDKFEFLNTPFEADALLRVSMSKEVKLYHVNNLFLFIWWQKWIVQFEY